MSARVPALGLGLILAACGGSPAKPEVAATETPTTPTATPDETPSAPPAPTATKSEPVEPAPEVDKPAAKPSRINTEAMRLLNAGKEIAAQGDLSTAAERFSAAASADPKAVEAHYNLGVLQEWQGHYDQAKKHYEDALSADPEFASAVVAIANMRLRRGDISGAITYAQQRLNQKRGSASLRNALNRVRIAAGGRADQVIVDAKAVLRADEKNVDAMINLASAYHEQGKYELTVAILENAKALDPENPEIFVRQATALRALKEDIKARVALEQATALPGGATAEAYNNLGLIYHEAGDFIGAETQFRKALARWPDMLAAQVNLGNALKGQQRYADADLALQGALKLAPTAPEVHYNLGILYLDGTLPNVELRQRLERALSYFQAYKQHRRNAVPNDPVEAYIVEATKRIEVEDKKAEQARASTKSPAPEPATGGAGDGSDDDSGGDGGGDAE